MARRSRKARPAPGAPPGPAAETAPDGAERMRRGYARAEARNAALRAQLSPLGPGEHPPALVVAIVLTSVLAIGNLAAFAAGVEVDGRRPGLPAVLVFAAVMLGLAAGMWRHSYWAVLGFEALLGITIAFAALSLLVASNVEAVVLCVAITVAGGWLFWKLVRIMARLQAPRRMG
jgi:hypothetical protein